MKNKDKKTLFMITWNNSIKLIELKTITSIFILTFLFSSCSAPKDITYFQGLKNLEEVTTSNDVSAIYKPQDIISIIVSASDPETAMPFNKVPTSVSSDNDGLTTSTLSSKVSKYLIDSNGMIEFPVIGELKISGLTNSEVKKIIKSKLKTYINNPIVSVKLENFKVTVLGEVNKPGPFMVNNERITLIEAIGLAGDLSIQGKRTNITVIRASNNKQTVYKVDLTSKDVFNSPVYYLVQNDIVYVEPNSYKAKSSRSNNNSRILGSVASVLGIIISIIAVTR